LLQVIKIKEMLKVTFMILVNQMCWNMNIGFFMIRPHSMINDCAKYVKVKI